MSFVKELSFKNMIVKFIFSFKMFESLEKFIELNFYHAI